MKNNESWLKIFLYTQRLELLIDDVIQKKYSSIRRDILDVQKEVLRHKTYGRVEGRWKSTVAETV